MSPHAKVMTYAGYAAPGCCVMKISGLDIESTQESKRCTPCLTGSTPRYSASPRQGIPVDNKHKSICRVPSARGLQKPPSATYLASRAKYVPEPQSAAPLVPDASGWKPEIGSLTMDSTASVEGPSRVHTRL